MRFHVIPRYDKEVEKYGIKWVDKEWSTGVSMYKTEVTEEILMEIKEEFMKGEY